MAWVAFDRAIRSAEEFGLEGPVTHWRDIRDTIHKQVVAHEQRPPELLLKKTHTGAHGCLTDIETLRRPDKASCRNDFQEDSGEFGVHASSTQMMH
jgi:hypothetical protein